MRFPSLGSNRRVRKVVEYAKLTFGPVEGNIRRAQIVGHYLGLYLQLERKAPDVTRERIDES